MHILQTCPDWLVADSHPPWKSPSWVLRRLCPAERFPLRQPNRCRVESTRLDHHRVPWNNDSLTWVSRWWFQILFIFTPIWGRFPIWLIFFKGVETTNQVWDVWAYAPSFWATVSNKNTWYRSSECQPATSKNDQPAITRSFQIGNIPAFCPQVFEWRWQCWWIWRRPSGFCSDRSCPKIFPRCVIAGIGVSNEKKGIHLDLYNSRKTKGQESEKCTLGKKNSYCI